MKTNVCAYAGILIHHMRKYEMNYDDHSNNYSELEAQYFIYHTNESVNTARQGLCYCKVGNTGQLQNGVGAISGLVAQCSGDCYTEG